MGTDGRRAQVAELAVPALTVAAAVGSMAAFWFIRAFHHDDFFFAYLSWIRTTAAIPVRDYFVPSFTPFADLFSPLFAWAPESFVPLDSARATILVAAILLLYVVFAVTRTISDSNMWGLCAAALTAWEPHFVLRIADIRSDPLSALALLTAALVLLRARDGRAFFLAGLLSGAAATLSLKLVVVLPLVIAGGIVAARRNRIERTVLLLLGLMIPPLLYGAFRVAHDGVDAVMLVVRDTIVTSGQQTVSRSLIAADALKAAPLFGLVIAIGAAGMLRRRDLRALPYALLAILSLAAYVAANPFLYPYNFVLLVPLVAPLVCGIEAWLPDRFSVRASVGAAVCLLAAAQGVPAMLTAVGEKSVDQRRLVQWIWSATSKDERVFDWQGMHFGRRGIRHWWIFTALIPRYRSGTWYSLADEWRSSRVTLMIDNYRFGAMTPSDRNWLEAHYVFIAPCALVPGQVFASGESVCDIAVEGDYQIAPPGTVLIDAQPAQSRMHLRAGKHTVSASQKFVLAFTTPLRDAAGPPPCPRSAILFTF